MNKDEGDSYLFVVRCERSKGCCTRGKQGVPCVLRHTFQNSRLPHKLYGAPRMAQPGGHLNVPLYGGGKCSPFNLSPVQNLSFPKFHRVVPGCFGLFRVLTALDSMCNDGKYVCKKSKCLTAI
jgi:hypothetical protein